jgi:hypothetical protein
VIDAGRVLSLPDERVVGVVDYRQRAYAAQRHGKVPAGKHLTVERHGGTFVISTAADHLLHQVSHEARGLAAARSSTWRCSRTHTALRWFGCRLAGARQCRDDVGARVRDPNLPPTARSNRTAVERRDRQGAAIAAARLTR